MKMKVCKSIDGEISQFGYFVFSIPLLILIFIGRELSKANLALCKFYLNNVLKGDHQ